MPKIVEANIFFPILVKDKKRGESELRWNIIFPTLYIFYLRLLLFSNREYQLIRTIKSQNKNEEPRFDSFQSWQQI